MAHFSLWCDFIEREFIQKDFVELLQSGKINAATSNPAIFKNAILHSKLYKNEVQKLKGKNAKEIYELLAVRDIQVAADKLAPYFAIGNDGFISLEIDPRLYDKTSLSLGEAKRLYSQISKPNAMIKIPATKQSYEVMSALMSEGINVNATLIFSLDQAKQCFEALNEGLKKFRQKNFASKGGVQSPKAVISVFVSRFDRLLNEKVRDKNSIGILTASRAYHFIISQNEPNIRTLFASTGVKGDDLPKDFYIKELLYENSVNTAPLDALEAFKGEFVFKNLPSDAELEEKIKANLSEDELQKACEFLLDDGLKQFCKAYEEILQSL